MRLNYSSENRYIRNNEDQLNPYNIYSIYCIQYIIEAHSTHQQHLLAVRQTLVGYNIYCDIPTNSINPIPAR